MGKLSDWLRELDACASAIQWAQPYNTLPKAWRECPRADWLLWLAGKMIGKKGWPTREQLVLAACDCAETALRYVPDGEDRPRVAIETARRWARGRATIGEVRKAADAAAYAAADAAVAAYAYADAAADAAARAADAADSRAQALRKMATIVRRRLKPGPMEVDNG